MTLVLKNDPDYDKIIQPNSGEARQEKVLENLMI